MVDSRAGGFCCRTSLKLSFFNIVAWKWSQAMIERFHCLDHDLVVDSSLDQISVRPKLMQWSTVEQVAFAVVLAKN